MYGNLPCPTLQATSNLNHLHHKTHNADNMPKTNYCKCGYLHVFIIIVHVKSALRAIAQILLIRLENKPITSVVIEMRKRYTPHNTQPAFWNIVAVNKKYPATIIDQLSSDTQFFPLSFHSLCSCCVYLDRAWRRNSFQKKIRGQDGLIMNAGSTILKTV